MRKRYDVRGMMEWHPVFKVGRSRLQVSFTGGHMCGGACSPATFETSDPAVQAIIENSKEFKDGKITIGMIMEGGHSDRQPEGLTRSAPEGANVREIRRASGQVPVGTQGCASSCVSGAAVNMAAPEHLVMMEVGSKAEAEDILTVKKGVPSERLGDFNACVAEARKLGIDLRLKS